MITIICKNCKNSFDPNENGYLEINLNEKVFFTKCPHCKKSDSIKLYREEKNLPQIRGL